MKITEEKLKELIKRAEGAIELGWANNSNNPNTIKSICQELLEAREALKFYSNWHNWTWEDKNKFHDFSELTNIVDDSNSLEYIEADGETYKNTFGGKRAREFLKKWGEK